jgi:eukaryotic translation initiation factor 2C
MFTSLYRTGKGSPGGDSGSDRKRLHKLYNTKTFKVELNFATKIPMSSIIQAMKGHESENSQEAF